MSKEQIHGQTTRVSTNESLFTMVSTGDFSLQVLDGPQQGTTLHLEEELVRIGRTEWCDLILLEDHWVSNVHCECWLDNKGVRLRDLNSRNGLLIDGSLIFDAYLRDGAIFQVGRTNIQLISHKQQRELAVQFTDKSGLLVGKSQAMRQIFSMLAKLARTDVNTLLTGETGTGKTSIAQAIHLQSPREKGPFVVVNCGALPSGLIEAQLFGYEKGAFTGASTQHQGFFEQASGGTLVLDEIAELPLALQPKLLDVLERRKVRRLGGRQEIDVDVRLIAATHRHLPQEIKEGRFREDLYFRLSVVVLEVPPLRQRAEDIPLLVNKLLATLSSDKPPLLTEPAMHALQEQLWPGNIRQLRNTLERATIFLEGGVIGIRDIERSTQDLGAPTSTYPSAQAPALAPTPTPTPPSAPPASQPSTSVPGSSSTIPSQLVDFLPNFPLSEQTTPLALKETLEAIEQALVAQALEETNHNAQEAAKLLGISLGWLYNRARKYDLSTKVHKR